MGRDRAEVQEGYERVLDGLRSIHRSKLSQYGLDRYQEADRRWQMIMCYSDCYRKNIRLRELTNTLVEGGAVDTAALRDAYQDLANYAIMAVQEIDHHYSKENQSV